jgi:acetyltransferase-like isoleucine patch superfamily enzyme
MYKKIYKLLRYDWPLHFVLVFTNWMPDNVAIMTFRGWLASFFFNQCGNNLSLGRNITFYNPSKITIGNNVYIANGCWFSSSDGVVIKDNILFGPYVIVVTSNHSIKNDAYFWGEPINKARVEIRSGAWIGGHVTLLPGSTVAECCLIAANSVYKGESIIKGIYAGQPAKLIKVADEK